MKDCKEYRDAPNPKPKPVVQRLWALTDQKGRFHRRSDDTITLSKDRLEGYTSWSEVWKPRRVRITVEAL